MKRMVSLLLVLFALAGMVQAQKLELYYYKQENQDGLKKLVAQFVSENPGITIDMLIVPNDADATMSARAAQG
ncbi:MAG: hypothetical protein WC784_06470, partial [Candidatus Shapirobacteria bacterium]